MSKNLIHKALEQIQEDVRHGDHTAIAELLERIPENSLREYLTEPEKPKTVEEYFDQCLRKWSRHGKRQ